MKFTHLILQGALLILAFCSFSSVKLDVTETTSQQLIEQTVVNDAVLGVWNYRMSNVDAPYEKGVFFITKNKDFYEVAVKLSTGILTGQDVVASDKGINFNVNFEGLKRVSFVLMVEEDKIMGETYSAIGTSDILGVRQKPVE
ncbi:hypothetical protein [Maribacter spongiicola]|uniref:hypothetical protein n=1 Tax=Maribacter spongiicola TaxID=1206753 RepID=UPI003F97974A